VSVPPRFTLDSLVDETLWLDEVESTNTFLAHRNTRGSVLALSWNQTAGRGRLGREWNSPSGESLALSVGLWPELVPKPLTLEWLGALSLVTGASLADAIRPHLSEPVRLKWPNDVLIGGKKVAGILGEVSADGRVIVGVGVNVLLARDQLPTDLATSLTLHGFQPGSQLQQVISAFMGGLRDTLSGLESGFTREKRAWVAEQCDTLGREVLVEFPGGGSRTGMAIDLDGAGRLLVHFDDSNVVESVDAADVFHLRPAH
jgi:BirA family biotin operon repressor/biotin-[acetyl-CoA-carboxylase] ligase